MAIDTEEMIRAQPMDAVRADRRLRQDGAGAAYGGDQRECCRHPAGDRPDARRELARRAARRLHRLPTLLGAISRRSDRRGGDRGRERRACANGGHLLGDGDGEHDGARRRGARHDVAGGCGRSRPCWPRAGAMPSRPGTPRRGAGSRAPHPGPDRDARFHHQCAAHHAGDRRLDQCADPPDRDRRARRHTHRSRRLRPARTGDAGSG